MSDVSLGVMDIDHVDAIPNMDTINLVFRLDAYMVQWSRCPSANTYETQVADLDIWDQCIADFDEQFTTKSGKDPLYLPRYSPKALTVKAPPEINRVQNPDAQHGLDMMAAMRSELLNGETAEKASGYSSLAIKVVVIPWIENMKAHLELVRENIDNDTVLVLPDANFSGPGINVDPHKPSSSKKK